MYKLLSRMVIYREFARDSILACLADIINRFDAGISDHDTLVTDIYSQINRLLVLAEQYGIEGNIWHHYLSLVLAAHENIFSLTCERREIGENSLSKMALDDFYLFRELFAYDFRQLEHVLRISCFSEISQYQAPENKSRCLCGHAGGIIKTFCRQLSQAETAGEFFQAAADFYRLNGVGGFALNHAFRINLDSGQVRLLPIDNTADVTLDDLIGYESQKNRLIANTKAFLAGGKANNLLLHGDSGTGKSTSIKAVLNMFADQGLRAVEIYRHQFMYLTDIMALVRNRNYKFIFFLDDLSFEEFETEFKFLKAIIEGGLEITPDNVLIYATSNRRHLIRETWTDRKDIRQSDDIHHSDTAEEKLSLVHRFGVTIYYPRPDEQEYLEIVRGIAAGNPAVMLPEDILLEEARRWGLWHGSVSGRRARQFINHLLGQNELD